MRLYLSWVLWALGHYIGYKVLLRLHLPFSYRVYNWLMLTSLKFQDKNRHGPWEFANEEDYRYVQKFPDTEKFEE